MELREPNKNLSIFKSTDPMKSDKEIKNIPVENLEHYEAHPFKLYAGQRFHDMVESIKINGIINPLIVRSKENIDLYEVLAGHNRLEAAKAIPLNVVPCIVHNNISNEDAELILIETNLMQRSFSELTLSEKAYVVSTYYQLLKKQGKRNDLVENINISITSCQTDENLCEATSCQTGKKLAGDETSEKYELSKREISRLVRINMLSNELKRLLDNGQLKKGAAEALSFLTEEQQIETYNYIEPQNIVMNQSEAEQLKQASQNNQWQSGENGTLHQTFWQEHKQPQSIRIKEDTIKKYFKPNQSKKDIQETIELALEMFFDFQKSEGNVAKPHEV